MAKNTLVLVFHPHLSDGSRANLKLAEAAAALLNVTVRDEYALYPDFKIDVKAEQEALLKADRVVWQFPFYWYSTPALLKQWEDLVLEHGWAYGHDGDKLHGKELQLAITVGATVDKYRHDGEFGVTGLELLKPLETTAKHIGMTFAKPFAIHGMLGITDKELDKAVADYVALLSE
ncbi:oxidoreductase [Bifidobacterium saguini DSM 23967]|uniref:Oxidoreductase n=2 Tax=Bifidobacterium saguini TaxID=762210 RepID=A0A087DF47_9BIFI|nr:NAD(P)H-dependent oxidoreductase [Bifidobacterium saguini]KFI94147.1 oxidoreductase [Bifidobacterium saguini DSM 23967]QTB90445.1 NAD(P)H-dependent oxidoreductase [Bifidobacterium saguini]